ncbi:MAG TPA: hypothetical protein VK015_00905 [Microbacterium sp.]|nr:hypothetical protein [Microbacterium sp.]
MVLGFVLALAGCVALVLAALTLVRENRGVRIPYIGRPVTDTQRAKTQRIAGFALLVVGGGVMTLVNPFNAAGFVLIMLVPALLILLRHNARTPPAA